MPSIPTPLPSHPARRGSRFLLLASAALAGAVFAAPKEPAEDKHAAAQTYRVINLGAGDLIGAAVLNASGQAAYALQVGRDGPIRAWFYDGAAFRNIGTLGAPFARVTGLNNAGQVAGVSQDTAGRVRSFVWQRGRGITDIGALPGATESWEPVINNKGEVAGYSTGDPLPYAHAFRWTWSGGMEDLGAFPGAAESISQATAINDAGLIAGDSLTASNDYHAFAWTRATGLVDIDTLGTRYSAPVAVSARNEVAGNFFVDGGATRAFVWTRAGGMRDIGAPGSGNAWVIGMSASGQVVGVTSSDGLDMQAMTWTRQAGMRMLGGLGGGVSSALAANNQGQVVGSAVVDDVTSHAFIWSAREGMVDLNRRLRNAPAGLELQAALAIADNGAIIASSNAGLVLLKPQCGCAGLRTLGPIAAATVLRAGAAFDASVGLAGEPTAGTANVSWNWGDGSGERAGSMGVGAALGSHTYAEPGIYTATATLTDLAGNRVAVSRKLVVLGRGAGGAGTFVAPSMPGKQFGFHSGLAQFSFVAPTGRGVDTRARLDFDVGTLHLRSTHLLAAGKPGQFAGRGTLNGVGNYRFSLAVAPGSGLAGRFGLKIWSADPASGAPVLVYDSEQAGGPGLRTTRGEIVLR